MLIIIITVIAVFDRRQRLSQRYEAGKQGNKDEFLLQTEAVWAGLKDHIYRREVDKDKVKRLLTG